MNKPAVLMSIRPEWCELIVSGKKTVEMRKTTSKYGTPIKCYIYCTQAKHNQYTHIFYEENKIGECINGKVIGEFVCDEIKDYPYEQGEEVGEMMYYILTADGEKTCLSYDELVKYGNGKTLYGWHISELKIYDNPKELREFKKYSEKDIRPCQNNKHCEYKYYDYSEGCNACNIDFDGDNCPFKKVTNPPQSWCYVEELEK